MSTRSPIAAQRLTTEVKPGARDYLMDAASNLMCERDTLDISLNEIALRAGVNSALVKYYFGNKLGMMIALLDRNLTKPIEQIKGLVEMDISPSQKMRIHVKGIMRLYFQYPYMQRLLVAVMRDATPDVAQDVASRLISPMAEAQAAILASGAESGDFREVDSKLFYFAVIGACDQIFSARLVMNYVHGIDGLDEELRRAYVEEITKIVMGGLKNG